jgi:PEP-CTERM motif
MMGFQVSTTFTDKEGRRMFRRFPQGGAFTGMVSLFVLGWIGPVCGEAKADQVLYSQPAQFPSSSFNALTSTYDPVSQGSIFMAYDNFTLSTTATVDAVSWQGFAFDTTTDGPALNSVQGFNIGFYNNNSSGGPGSQAYNATVEMTNVTSTLVGTTDFFNNGQLESVYNYSASLFLGGFPATAGTTYWLSIQGIIDNPDYWTWTSGTGGDAQSYLIPSNSNPFPFDLAFTLDGELSSANSTPEPSTLLMAGLGALAVIGHTSRARRRRAD